MYVLLPEERTLSLIPSSSGLARSCPCLPASTILTPPRLPARTASLAHPCLPEAMGSMTTEEPVYLVSRQIIFLPNMPETSEAEVASQESQSSESLTGETQPEAAQPQGDWFSSFNNTPDWFRELPDSHDKHLQLLGRLLQLHLLSATALSSGESFEANDQ